MIRVSEWDCTEDRLMGERRRGLRVRQSRPVKVLEPLTGRYYAGQTEDISSAGLRVELPASVPVQPGKMLGIHIGVAEGGQPLANRRQMIPAKVVWMDPAGATASGRIMAGVEFLASVAAQLDAA